MIQIHEYPKGITWRSDVWLRNASSAMYGKEKYEEVDIRRFDSLHDVMQGDIK